MAEVTEDFSTNPFNNGWTKSIEKNPRDVQDDVSQTISWSPERVKMQGDVINEYSDRQSAVVDMAATSPEIISPADEINISMDCSFNYRFSGAGGIATISLDFAGFELEIQGSSWVSYYWGNYIESEDHVIKLKNKETNVLFSKKYFDQLEPWTSFSFDFKFLNKSDTENEVLFKMIDNSNGDILFDKDITYNSNRKPSDLGTSVRARLDSLAYAGRTFTFGRAESWFKWKSVSVESIIRGVAGNIRRVGNITAGDSDNELDVEIAWNNPDDVDIQKVFVQRSTSSIPKKSGDGTTVFSTTTSTQKSETVSFVDENIQKDTTYYYSVFVEDADGNIVEKIKLDRNAILIDTSNLKIPALIDDFKVNKRPNFTAEISWTNPNISDLSEVIIRRKTDDYPSDHTDGEAVLRSTSPNSSQADSTVDDEILPNTKYFYAIFPKRGAGGLWNDEVVISSNGGTV